MNNLPIHLLCSMRRARAEASTRVFYKKRCSWKFEKIHRKKSAPKELFPVNFAKCLRASFLQNTFGRLCIWVSRPQERPLIIMGITARLIFNWYFQGDLKGNVGKRWAKMFGFVLIIGRRMILHVLHNFCYWLARELNFCTNTFFMTAWIKVNLFFYVDFSEDA